MTALVAMAVGGLFPSVAVEKCAADGASGPSSNTGQKGSGALIDYFTVVIPNFQVEDRGLSDLRNLIDTLFGLSGELLVTAIRNKPWQFYPQSAVVLDREGEMAGRIGLGGNKDTICISLSGVGTRWVRHWERVAIQLADLRGRISRVDVAFDDYEGELLDVHALREDASANAFQERGCPPKHRFLSDEGHGSGSTLYVGGKGHKELCVYEKGKQLGAPLSRWVRAEVRLYGKHVALPLEILTEPLTYLLGAYSHLAHVLASLKTLPTRMATTRKTVEVSGVAMLRWVKRQCGPTINLLRDVFGPDWAEFVGEHVAREGHPGRFRGVARGDRLVELMRNELCPSAS